MQVVFLKPTEYEPTAADQPNCWGQLRMRPSTIETEVEKPDGSKAIERSVGPMVRFFPIGARPELPEQIALAFIASGAAERVVGQSVQFVSTAEILKDVKADP